MCEGHCETSLIFGEHGRQFLFFSLMFNFIYFISSTHLYCYVFLPHICQRSLIKLHSITANLTLYNCNTLRYNTSNLKKFPLLCKCSVVNVVFPGQQSCVGLLEHVCVCASLGLHIMNLLGTLVRAAQVCGSTPLLVSTS